MCKNGFSQIEILEFQAQRMESNDHTRTCVDSAHTTAPFCASKKDEVASNQKNLRGGPLLVTNGVINPINGRK